MWSGNLDFVILYRLLFPFMGLFVATGVFVFLLLLLHIASSSEAFIGFWVYFSSSSSSFFVQSRGKDSVVESLLLVRISGGIISFACKFTQLLLPGGDGF